MKKLHVYGYDREALKRSMLEQIQDADGQTALSESLVDLGLDFFEAGMALAHQGATDEEIALFGQTSQFLLHCMETGFDTCKKLKALA